jgi:hypothetical protein
MTEQSQMLDLLETLYGFQQHLREGAKGDPASRQECLRVWARIDHGPTYCVQSSIEVITTNSCPCTQQL